MNIKSFFLHDCTLRLKFSKSMEKLHSFLFLKTYENLKLSFCFRRKGKLNDFHLWKIKVFLYCIWYTNIFTFRWIALIALRCLSAILIKASIFLLRDFYILNEYISSDKIEKFSFKRMEKQCDVSFLTYFSRNIFLLTATLTIFDLFSLGSQLSFLKHLQKKFD